MLETFVVRNEILKQIINEGKGVELIGSGYITSDEQTNLIEYLASKRVEEKEIQQTASVSIPNIEVKYGV